MNGARLLSQDFAKYPAASHDNASFTRRYLARGWWRGKMTASPRMGKNMRMISVLKVVALAGSLALVSNAPGASAKMMKMPPGACAFSKKAVVANGMMCSYQCNPATMWCSQQLCSNGQWTQIISCFGTFCTKKCG
jgi:hypothetical protein